MAGFLTSTDTPCTCMGLCNAAHPFWLRCFEPWPLWCWNQGAANSRHHSVGLKKCLRFGSLCRSMCTLCTQMLTACTWLLNWPPLEKPEIIGAASAPSPDKTRLFQTQTHYGDLMQTMGNTPACHLLPECQDCICHCESCIISLGLASWSPAAPAQEEYRLHCTTKGKATRRPATPVGS